MRSEHRVGGQCSSYGNWRKTTIGQEASLQRGYDITKEKQSPGPIPVVSSGGIFSYHDTAKVKGPGVVFGRKSNSIGRTYYVTVNYWPHDTTLWVTNFHGNDPRFVYYFFLNLYPRLVVLDVGSANPTLNRNHIHPMEVMWPPIKEQIAISRLLGSLDDKIDLNRRMNETLEAMAGALFRSWFVDFDPVRAKQEGRQPPGLDAATAALFPDSFADSPLGPIPTGWRPGHFGDVADHPRRVVNPLGIEPETPYIGLEHMPRRSIALTNWGRSGDVTSQKARFNRGEILFGKLRPYFHKVGVAAIDGVCSTDILVVVPKRPQDFGFVLGHVGSGEFISHTDASSGGTRMPRTNWAEMSRYSIVIPPDPVSKAFTSTIRPLVSLILSNIHQSQTLAALRDALLPKLLSGEIRVGDLETSVQ